MILTCEFGGSIPVTGESFQTAAGILRGALHLVEAYFTESKQLVHKFIRRTWLQNIEVER